MCDHVWREVREEFLLGGHFPVGYRCQRCGKHVGQHELTPGGLGGITSSKVELVGPHGAVSQTRTGRRYRRQVYDKVTGKLDVEYAD